MEGWGEAGVPRRGGEHLALRMANREEQNNTGGLRV